MLISGKLFYCLRLITWCLSQVLDTCCLLKEIWLDLRFRHSGNYQTKIKLHLSMPIPPLQIKWHLAILTWTINKSMKQSNQNNLSEATNEYNNRHTEVGQSSTKTSKQDFSPEEPTKHLFCIPWDSKSPQHLSPHFRAVAKAKYHKHNSAQKGKRASLSPKSCQWQAVVCTSAPHNYHHNYCQRESKTQPVVSIWSRKNSLLHTGLTVRINSGDTRTGSWAHFATHRSCFFSGCSLISAPLEGRSHRRPATQAWCQQVLTQPLLITLVRLQSPSIMTDGGCMGVGGITSLG